MQVQWDVSSGHLQMETPENYIRYMDNTSKQKTCKWVQDCLLP